MASRHWVYRPPRGDNDALGCRPDPWNSPSAFAPLHPDTVALAGQRGGEATRSKPEVETLCF